MNAKHVKRLPGNKTDRMDSRWLGRVCQFGLARSSYVPAREFRELRLLRRHRRGLVQDRSRVRNRLQKVLDRSGARIGGVLTDVFGCNGRRIREGLAAGPSPERILATLDGRVGPKKELLATALEREVNGARGGLLRD